ncbi:hypothetical protein [Desulfospira joergensenii]|uniref:hypothetical protein n=1 Tax=Desulfospira joergensenii TaxID=53329 RepID=UPI0003B2F045|nr:hypothetical protein [Desulfospira joergensenii]
MRKITVLFIVLAWSHCLWAAETFVLNRGIALYVPKTEHIRAFIEPGTLLKKLEVPYEDRYRGRARVITPGGLLGEIIKGSYDESSKVTSTIAYLKHPFLIEEKRFNSGDIFKVSVIEHFQGTRYKLFYPVPFYRFEKNDYGVKEADPVTFKEQEFFSNFNLYDPEAPPIRFPYWAEKDKQNIEWGCGNDRTETSTIKIGAGGKVSGGGGFFKFFEAEVHAENENEKTITYTKELKDSENTHKMSFWALYEGYESETPLLEIALEKISSCDESKKFQYSYKIHFPKDDNIDPIIINKVWVDEHQLTPGGASPVGLKNLSDYRAFKNAINDFKFHYQRSGYDMDAVLLHLLMKFTANISLGRER